MKSKCCASSITDHTGCATAINSAGTTAARYANTNTCLRTATNALARIAFAVDAENAEEEACEYGLHSERQEHRGRDHLTHRRARIEDDKAERLPRQHGEDQAADAKHDHQQAEHEPRFEAHVAEHRRVGGIGRVKTLAHGEDLGEDREDDELVTDQTAKTGEQQSADIEAKRSDLDRPHLERGAHDQP